MKSLSIRSILLYVGAFLLLIEWLHPLSVVTDTGEIQYFIFFVSITFLLLMLQTSFFIVTVINAAFVLYAVNRIYYQTPFLSAEWFSAFVDQTSIDIGRIIGWQIPNLSVEMRTCLFFILLWIMAYLIRYWIFYQQKIFFFFLLTIVYVTVLDTFSEYDATFAIVRVVAIGFLLLGFLRLHIDGRTKQKLSHVENRARSFFLLLGVLLIAVGVAYIAPKSAPKWPDPVPFLTAYTQNSGEGASNNQRIGYDTDDSQLGGAFTADDTVVFTAQTEKEHYWRIETKDVYTGKGWETSYNAASRPLEGNENVLPQYGASVEKESYTASIKFEQPTIHLMHVPELKSISLNDVLQPQITPANEKLFPYNQGRVTEAKSYEMTYAYPTFNIEQLQNSDRNGVSIEQNSSFQNRYTQLPESLPNRVGQLAQEITAEEATRYDKVKAVEKYFQANGFVYDTNDVAIPGEGEDYVDQFLFETLRGYCDNFSSSMVVLLRTLDIPARWVKGYTEGEQISASAETPVYEVTQNNAHSWVEVYFPGTGWVPFEPTKTFSNPYEFDEPQVEGNNQGTEEEEIEEATEPEVEEPVQEEQKPEEKQVADDEKVEPSDAAISLWWLLLLIPFSFILLYMTRYKWLPRVMVPYYRKRSDEKAFEKAYFFLISMLARKGLKRDSHETLKDFALRVDHQLHTNEMSELTRKYERVIYKQQSSVESWSQSVELWENLIKTTGS
ncbi:transglutaminaseTgpA domain-containing protein [Priestia flexa]|uniref:transglutaminase TgpA family protein n=1 Tax=Priestia flexa TaxID=86664 RepID=UPI00209D07AE|nr:transglutaminaseTgpA domain-containing protein [Priestia flexa]MCP1187799.1 transglutaminaseTgpA domain-containing protein [Priestia flexa]